MKKLLLLALIALLFLQCQTTKLKLVSIDLENQIEVLATIDATGQFIDCSIKSKEKPLSLKALFANYSKLDIDGKEGDSISMLVAQNTYLTPDFYNVFPCPSISKGLSKYNSKLVSMDVRFSALYTNF